MYAWIAMPREGMACLQIYGVHSLLVDHRITMGLRVAAATD